MCTALGASKGKSKRIDQITGCALAKRAFESATTSAATASKEAHSSIGSARSSDTRSQEIAMLNWPA